MVPFQQILSSAEATVEARLSTSLTLTAFVDIQKSFWGTVKEAAIGLTLEGKMDSNLEIKINKKLRFDVFSLSFTSIWLPHLFDLTPPSIKSRTESKECGVY